MLESWAAGVVADGFRMFSYSKKKKEFRRFLVKKEVKMKDFM